MTAVIPTASSAVLLTGVNGVNLPLSWTLRVVVSRVVLGSIIAIIGALSVEIIAIAAMRMASALTAENQHSPTTKANVSSALKVPITTNSKRNAAPAPKTSFSGEMLYLSEEFPALC